MTRKAGKIKKPKKRLFLLGEGYPWYSHADETSPILRKGNKRALYAQLTLYKDRNGYRYVDKNGQPVKGYGPYYNWRPVELNNKWGAWQKVKIWIERVED